MFKYARLAAQVLILICFSLIGNYISDYFHLAMPGSITGLLILFILLHFKVIHLSWVEAGANWLLAELLLFFIPSAIGIIQYKSYMATDGLRFLAVIACSTLMVMICSGLIAEFIYKLHRRLDHAHIFKHN